MLSVLLCFTYYDYTFGIFKLLFNNINLKLYVSTIDNFAEIGNDSGHVLDLENTTLKY